MRIFHRKRNENGPENIQKDDNHQDILITLDDVSVCTADGKKILSDISVSIARGERIVLFGPSGAGKSTLMKTAVGLIAPDQGTVQNHASRISLVFQKEGLFPEISCRKNISYGLEYGRFPRTEIDEKTLHWAKVFCCDEFLDQRTSTLSGGEQQRAALARAFLKDPDLLLMDESFSSLDFSLHRELLDRILQLQKEKGFTVLYTTHDREDLEKFPTQIWLIRNGHLQQILKGPLDPQEILSLEE